MKDEQHHERLPQPEEQDATFLSTWVQAAREDVPDERDWQHARTKLLQSLEQTSSRRTPMLHVIHYAARHRWLTAAALAALFFSILIGFNPWSRSLALSKVIQQIREIRAYTTKTTYSLEDGEIFTIETMYLAPGKWRMENIGGNVHIIDLDQGVMLNLFPRPRMAMLLPIGEQKVSERLEHMWLEKLRDFEGQADEALPGKMVNGQFCSGFLLRRPDHELTIWAARDTGLPVRLEVDIVGPMNTRLEVDVDYPDTLDPELFSLEIPEGYQMMEGQPEEDPQ